jgi:hypothetical protein
MTGLHCRNNQSSPYLLLQAAVHLVAVSQLQLVFQLPVLQQQQEQWLLQQLQHSQKQRQQQQLFPQALLQAPAATAAAAAAMQTRAKCLAWCR